MVATNSRSSRQQLQDVPSALITNADRNIILTGGGTISWDQTNNVLSWTVDFYLRIPGQTGSVYELNGTSGQSIIEVADGDYWYTTLTRGTSTTLTTYVSSAAQTSATFYKPEVDGSIASTSAGGHAGILDGDDIVVLGVRSGNDFFLRNGTAIEGSSTATTTTTLTTETPQPLHQANAMVYFGVSPTTISSYAVAVATAPYNIPAAGLEVSAADKIDIQTLDAWDDPTTYPAAQSMPTGTLFTLGTWE